MKERDEGEEEEEGEVVKRWEEENNEDWIREGMGREDEEGGGKMNKKEIVIS